MWNCLSVVWSVIIVVWCVVQPPLVEPNGEDSHKSPPDSDKRCDPKPDVVINMPLLEIHTVGGLLVKMPNVRS